MNTQTLLKQKISYCQGKNNPKTHETTISEALEEIKSVKNKISIEKIRETKDKSEKSALKGNLKGFLFSGFFTYREKTSLAEYSKVCILDFDDLDEEKINGLKEILVKNPYIFAFWCSPSGKGIKALIGFDCSCIEEDQDIPEFHSAAYTQFKSQFESDFDYKLDPSGSDISRLCFTSYDPQLVIKQEIELYPVKITPTTIDIKKKSEKKISNRNVSLYDESMVKNIARETNSEYRKKMSSIIKYLRKRNLSITETYAEWYKIGKAIANTFSYSIGKEYYLKLCRLDGPRHSESKSIDKIIECYEQSIDEEKHSLPMYTILSAAMKKGWKNKVKEVPVEKDLIF